SMTLSAPLPVAGILAADMVTGALSTTAPLPAVAVAEMMVAWPPRAGSIVVIPVATGVAVVL
ncbi:MAG: hypothetical protein ACRDTT_00335, partial [Pseudonocardiaceae bacterium]